MTLKKFVLWLGEKVESPSDKKQQIPRLITYLEDRNGRTSASDYTPDRDSHDFEPSGAVTDMFGSTSHSDSRYCGTKFQDNPQQFRQEGPGL